MPQSLTRDLFSNELRDPPEIIVAPRSDPIYNAHGYLTKVPVDAILPYIERFSDTGDLVVDLFAGSGMTAVAARIAGRRAIVSDISILGRHIGCGYIARVDETALRSAAREAVAAARKKLGTLYDTMRETDGARVEMIRTIWSFVYECTACRAEIDYYGALLASGWHKPSKCPSCGAPFSKSSAAYKGDRPVLVVVEDTDGRQIEQPLGALDATYIEKARVVRRRTQIPSLSIESHREMYRRSALQKWGLEGTQDFFSDRNALALKYLHDEVRAIRDPDLRQKLLFAFTAILPRASRRYQWSRQRPLNAANQNYYIAPVYYEWNVFDLFGRKVEAALRSDAEIASRAAHFGMPLTFDQTYVTASADALTHLSDASVDYVFTDPPFGSNIFYSDMNLFQEAWLDGVTDDRREAVMHTAPSTREKARHRYEQVLLGACREAYRVLKPGRYMSMVFGNSSGSVWSIAQRALIESGFRATPAHISILDKGQRSVKGLSSGREGVTTLDLIVTVQKPEKGAAKERVLASVRDPIAIIDKALDRADLSRLPTPSHVYLTILKEAIAERVPLEQLHYSDVLLALRHRGFAVNPRSGHIERTRGRQSSPTD